MGRGAVKVIGGLLAVAVSLAFPAFASAADPPLAFGGVGEEPVPVVFAASKDGDAVASLSLVVESNSTTSGRLSLEFLPQLSDEGPVRVLPETGAPTSASVLVAGRTLPRIGANGAVPVVVRFRVPHGQSPSLATGTLLADLQSKTGKVVSSATLRVTGQLGPVDILPAKVTLQHTKGCLISCGHDSADVEISGPGAQALPQSGVVATAILSGDRSGTASVELSRDEGQWKVSRVDSALGQKTGKLPLVTGLATPPQIDVVVQDGYWFGVAALVVLLGALLGSGAVPFYGIARRRTILKSALGAALDRYKEAAATAEKAATVDVPRPTGYPLATELGCEDTWNTTGCQPYQGPRGVRAAMCRIVTSRSDADFAECEKEVTELIATIDGWIALEPVVAQAQQTLKEAGKVSPKDGKSFGSSQVCVDLAQLIDEACLYRPSDLAEVEKKAGHLQSQMKAVVKAQAVWTARDQVLTAAGEGELHGILKRGFEDLPAADLLEAGSEPTPPRTTTEAAALNASLDVSLRRALALKEDLSGAMGEKAAVAVDEAAQQAKEAVHRIEAENEGPAVKPYVAATARSSVKDLTPSDLALSLVAGTATAIAYTATIYSDTWGSAPEFATAFTAGFLAPSVAQWAAFPIFKSVRWHSDSGAGAKSADTTDDASHDSIVKAAQAVKAEADGNHPPVPAHEV